MWRSLIKEKGMVIGYQFSEFCKDIVCIEHIRKKRKYKNTNKFVRICDDCEDKYLYDKYKSSESKAEEALAMQEMIV